jgi:hypothetical protein
VPYSGTFLTPPMNALGIGVKLNDDGTAADTGAPGYWQGKLDDIGLFDALRLPDAGLSLVGVMSTDSLASMTSFCLSARADFSITAIRWFCAAASCSY